MINAELEHPTREHRNGYNEDLAKYRDSLFSFYQELLLRWYSST